MPNIRLRLPFSLASLWRACSREPGYTIGGSLVVATLVAVVDYWTGNRFPLAICYLPSILLVCWVSNFAIGMCLAMVCSTAWLIDDLLFIGIHSVTLDEYWTALTHFGYYLVVMSMLMRIRVAQEREEGLSRTDHLTGLMNNKAFREAAQREIERAKRTGLPLTVAYIDCDNFKKVNDQLGHTEGDQVLAAVGETMLKNVRSLDSPARMGGDEFTILLPGTTRETAQPIIERLRRKLHARMQDGNWPVAFSIGVTVFATVPDSVDELIHRSDLLMLRVKRKGKDAVAYEIHDENR